MKVKRNIIASNGYAGFSAMLAICLFLTGNMASAAEPVLEFTGSGSYVNLGTPGALQIPSGEPFTVEGWIYLNSRSSRDMLYCKNNARSGSPYDYMLGFINGDITAYDGGSWRYPSPSGDPIQTEQWYHVAFSYDGDDMHFYLDGELVGTYTGWSFSNNPDNSVKLGGYTGSDGDIDGHKSDVRVWNVARNEQEIQGKMNNRLLGSEPGLVGYWPLNEGDGTTAFDATANVNDGDIIGATWTSVDDLTLIEMFAILDLQTGSSRFTNSNKVEVTLPVLELGDYDLHQFTESAAQPTNGWSAFDANDPPATATFAVPDPEGEVWLYAWFTNDTETAAARVYSNSIEYIRQTADLTATTRDTVATTFGESLPAMVAGEQVDDGSASSVGIYDIWLSAVADEKSEEDYVTFSDPGDYTVVLTAMDMAGNTDETKAQVTVVDGTEGPGTNLWEIPRNQMEARATSSWRQYLAGRALHPNSVWRLGRTGYSLPNSLILKLHGSYPVGGFAIYSTSYLPKAYRVYVTDTLSMDPADWGDALAMGQLPDESVWHTVTFGAVQGSYLVIEFTEGYSTARLYVNEVRAYADRPFVLASPRTGNTHYTWTNTVDVANFPVLPDYDRYQITESDQAPAAQDPGWQAYDPGTPPATVTFDEPDPEGDITLYAWFRDSGGTLDPVGVPSTIAFRRDSASVDAAAPSQVTAYAWGTGMPAVIRAFDMRPQVPPQHEPYLGADSSATVGLHSLTVSCPRDETPERDDIVTLSTPGEYTVTFTATDRAGNRDSIAVETAVKRMAAHVIGKRVTEDWTGPSNTRTWPVAAVTRGPHLPHPPRYDWIVQWPQQWLVDHVGGEHYRANLQITTPGLGRYEQHSTTYAYIEGSGSMDVDMRVDFRTGGASGSHNPGLVARFHPNDPGVENNTRRGYRLYMIQSGDVQLARIVDGSITTIASQSAVVVDGVWMTARLLVERAPGGKTRLRAKVWEVADPEPEDWTLDFLDDTPELQTPGLLGIFGHTSSNRRFNFRDFEAIRMIYGSLIQMR